MRRVRLEGEDPDVQRDPRREAERADEAEALAVGPAEEAAKDAPLAAPVVARVGLGRDGEAAAARPFAKEGDRLRPLDPRIRVDPRVAGKAREMRREERAGDVRPEGARTGVAPRERDVPPGRGDADAARLQLLPLGRKEADVEDPHGDPPRPGVCRERVEKAPEKAVEGVVRRGDENEVFGHLRGGDCRERP